VGKGEGRGRVFSLLEKREKGKRGCSFPEGEAVENSPRGEEEEGGGGVFQFRKKRRHVLDKGNRQRTRHGGGRRKKNGPYNSSTKKRKGKGGHTPSILMGGN